MAASVLLADAVYNVPCNTIIDSAMRAVASWDIVTSMIKCWLFGTIIAIVSEEGGREVGVRTLRVPLHDQVLAVRLCPCPCPCPFCPCPCPCPCPIYPCPCPAPAPAPAPALPHPLAHPPVHAPPRPLLRALCPAATLPRTLTGLPPSRACLVQVSCSWGYTTSGGAKGVGESTTSAVVISLVLIFIFDFLLSFLFFQGQGDALKQLS